VNEKKRLFVLGAGASHASGSTPLGADLVWKYHESCMLFSPVEGGKIDNTAENERFKNLDKFLVLAGQIYPELDKEVQKFRNRQQFMYTPPLFLHKKYYVDEILRILQEDNSRKDIILIKKLIVEHIVGSSMTEKNRLYGIFKERVLKSEAIENTSIITFNFDYLLREKTNDGLCFNYIIEFDSDFSYRNIICEDIPTTSFVPLIKLNGSLDWGMCPNCDRIVKYRSPINRLHYDSKSCQCGGQMEPFIVMAHEKYSDKIEPLWDEARRRLKQANKIVIIGYSFPEYDTRVIHLFRENISKSAIIEVVDVSKPDEREKKEMLIRERYSVLFPDLQNEVNINLNGFKSYLNA